MLNATEADQYIKNLTFGTLKSPERKAYAEGITFANSEFRSHCIYQYADHLTPAAAQYVWSRAWSDGHSEGFNRVEAIFEDLIDFLHDIESAS